MSVSGNRPHFIVQYDQGFHLQDNGPKFDNIMDLGKGSEKIGIVKRKCGKPLTINPFCGRVENIR